MKKSISQFKRSLYFKALLLSFFIPVGCIVKDKKDASQPLGLDDGSSKSHFIVIHNQKDQPIASFNLQSCQEPMYQWRVSFESIFGKHHAVFEAAKQGFNKDNIAVHIDGHTIDIKSDSIINEVQKICDAFDKKDGDMVVYRGSLPFYQNLETWLQAIAPDCEISFNKYGWSCRLPSMDPYYASTELKAVKSTMIRRWSRQPYIMSRRLAITHSLAEALQSAKRTEELAIFCKVLRLSAAIELPVTFTSDAWKTIACDPMAKSRDLALTFGLAKATEEIDFLRRLFENTSKLGYLTLKIPKAKAPSRVLWVSLSPSADVSQNLMQKTTEHAKRNDKEFESGACWHPMFGPTDSLMMKARALQLIGHHPKTSCSSLKEGTEGEKYLVESITSETEFVVSNGMAKMLRLPRGTYLYAIHGLPDDPQEWDDASTSEDRSVGSIEWNRRNPTIRRW